MKPKEVPKFSWSGFFLATSFSFLIFSGLIKLINGSALHSAIFIKIGIASLALSAFTFATSLDKEQQRRKKRSVSHVHHSKTNH